MKSNIWIQPLAVLATLVAGCGAPEQVAETPRDPEVLRQYPFTLNPGVTIPVLRRDVFLRRFEDNPRMPRTDDAIVKLAHKVFVAPELLKMSKGDTCGEFWEGTVLGALSNPHIADSTRKKVDQLMAAPLPPFPKTHTSAHFKFYYTDSDPDTRQNVTLTEVKATAKVLEATWADYVKNFTTPQHKIIGGQQVVQVRIYYLGGTLYGSTSSASNYIKLSSNRVARFRCKRESTPAHELFHRVQYASGYLSGASEKYWAVEGTAVWSQKYRASHIGDYLSRLGTAMASPDKALFSRKYDAVTLWLHLGRWTGDERAGVKLLWQNFKASHDKYRYALVPSLNATIQTLVGRSLDHEWLVEQWSIANLTKDAHNPAYTRTYEEQGMVRRCEGSIYGPVPVVKFTKTATIKVGPPLKVSDKVTAYGSDYLVFNLDPAVKKVVLDVKGDAEEYAFNVVERDAGGSILGVHGSGRHKKTFSLSRTITPGGAVRLGLVITAMSRGGSWSVEVTGQ